MYKAFTKFLSEPININILIVLLSYGIMYMAYMGVDTAIEGLILFFLLCFNNILFYIRGVSFGIFHTSQKNDIDIN